MESESTKPNIKLFCDIKVFLGLVCILPILEFLKKNSSLLKLVMFLFVILLFPSRVLKKFFTICIVMSKQCMGIMTLVSFWTLWTITMMSYIMFGLSNQLHGLKM